MQMANKHMKICSIPLVTGEMKIKTTMIYHFIPARMTVIITVKTLENEEYWQLKVCGEIGNFLPGWWENKMVYLLRKTAWPYL